MAEARFCAPSWELQIADFWYGRTALDGLPGVAPHKLLEAITEICSLNIVLPSGAGKNIRLRTVSRPEPHLAILLQELDLPLPNKPESI